MQDLKSMNGVLHEEPERSVFEGQVLKVTHEWGDDYDVQAGGWDGQPPDTWLAEHVLARFEGKRVRVTVEVLDDIATEESDPAVKVAKEGTDGHA